jgi:hypothetical protein
VTTTSSDTRRFVVECPDYRREFSTLAHAETWCEQVSRLGACRHEHVITERESDDG